MEFSSYITKCLIVCPSVSHTSDRTSRPLSVRLEQLCLSGLQGYAIDFLRHQHWIFEEVEAISASDCSAKISMAGKILWITLLLLPFAQHLPTVCESVVVLEYIQWSCSFLMCKAVSSFAVIFYFHLATLFFFSYQ